MFIGVSAPGIQPDWTGGTYADITSYGLRSDGDVVSSGQGSVFNNLPASAITQVDVLNKRHRNDRAFTAGDEVVVVLDCAASTLRLQSATVNLTMNVEKKVPAQQWVLNVNFWSGEYLVQMLPADS